MTGFFVVFEGGDGVGKTTQIDLLAGQLRAPAGGGYDVLVTREPGGTPLGEQLRQVVMHGDHVAPRAEALLYAADRAHHIHTKVRPALGRGAVVIQDRYLDSSIVYQGGARGLGDEVERISMWGTQGLLPHLTVVLDMEPVPGRMDRALDRVERETTEYRTLIREAFLTLAARAPERYAVIEADRPVEEVAADVYAAVLEAMRRNNIATAHAQSGPSATARAEGVEPWGTP